MKFETSIASVKSENDLFTHQAQRQVAEQQQGAVCGSASNPIASGSVCGDPSQQRSRPFLCLEPGCGVRFQRKFALHEHIRSHTGEKPFQCDVASCGKQFSIAGNLRRHRRLHKLKRFLCPAKRCERAYVTYDKLTRHYRVHLGSAGYPCNNLGCAKSFATLGDLKRHMQKCRCSGISVVQRSTIPEKRTSGVDAELIEYSGAILPFTPITSPLLISDGISEQDLVECLQCLFVDESLLTTES